MWPSAFVIGMDHHPTPKKETGSRRTKLNPQILCHSDTYHKKLIRVVIKIIDKVILSIIRTVAYQSNIDKERILIM